MGTIENVNEILKRALNTRFCGEQINILKYQNVRTSARHTNFLSNFCIISVTYSIHSDENEEKERTESVAIKREPLNVRGALDLVRKQNLFATEVRILRDVLPRIERIVKERIGPTLWYGCEDSAVMVMEDLTKNGFVMKNCQQGLSFNHCKLFLQKLAKFHAGSVKVYEQDPGLIKSFNTGIVSDQCPITFKKLMEVSLLNISSAVKEWFDEKCKCTATKLTKLAKTISLRCTEAYNYNINEFCVLNHGDSWVNNIMFRENERGQPYDVILVDYQMSVYTSPAIDLIYFLNISPMQSIKYDKDNELLKVYLDTLTNTMTEIGCKTKPPTMEELKDSIQQRRIYAVFSGLVLYLRMIANKEDIEDFDEVLIKLQGKTKMNVFKNPVAIEATRKMLPVMNARGYLD